MKEFFSYVRVSTTRQGEEGVSLQQQKEANEACAARRGLTISRVFEEKQTAAKRGRPIFSKMLALLKTGKAAGVIVHKIDRSARNLKDWADLGELIDSGIQVHFANESLDLNSRGGRLAADIQAVVAADYVRNLREETLKGFYGRLKQGLSPMPAPIGYLDHGKGKPKTIDPEKGPLVRVAFELYASGAYSLDELVKEMCHRGLRSRTGNFVGRNSMSHLLNRRFYLGEIEIKKTGQRFIGNHAPLLEPGLFERVQEVLLGRYPTRRKIHDFTFRRLFSCDSCGYSLIGETHKGFIYYRCHSKECPTTSVSERQLDRVLESVLSPLEFSEAERAHFAEAVREASDSWRESKQRIEKALTADLERFRLQAQRLLEAYMDGLIDKQEYEQKKTDLEINRRHTERRLNNSEGLAQQSLRSLQDFLELAMNADLLYKTASKQKKRELLEILTSNRVVKRKSIEIMLHPAALALASRPKYADGGPTRDTARKTRRFLLKLVELLGLPPATRSQVPNA